MRIERGQGCEDEGKGGERKRERAARRRRRERSNVCFYNVKSYFVLNCVAMVTPLIEPTT